MNRVSLFHGSFERSWGWAWLHCCCCIKASHGWLSLWPVWIGKVPLQVFKPSCSPGWAAVYLMPFWRVNIVSYHYGFHRLLSWLSLFLFVCPPPLLTFIYSSTSPVDLCCVVVCRVDVSLFSHILKMEKRVVGIIETKHTQTTLQTAGMNENHKRSDSIPSST